MNVTPVILKKNTTTRSFLAGLNVFIKSKNLSGFFLCFFLRGSKQSPPRLLSGFCAGADPDSISLPRSQSINWESDQSCSLLALRNDLRVWSNGPSTHSSFGKCLYDEHDSLKSDARILWQLNQQTVWAQCGSVIFCILFVFSTTIVIWIRRSLWVFIVPPVLFQLFVCADIFQGNMTRRCVSSRDVKLDALLV